MFSLFSNVSNEFSLISTLRLCNRLLMYSILVTVITLNLVTIESSDGKNAYESSWELFRLYASPQEELAATDLLKASGEAKPHAESTRHNGKKWKDRIGAIAYIPAPLPERTSSLSDWQINNPASPSVSLSLEEEEALVESLRVALLYSVPWLVLSGTAEQTDAQVHFLLRSPSVPGRLFPADLISILKTTNSRRLASELAGTLSEFHSIEAWLQHRRILELHAINLENKKIGLEHINLTAAQEELFHQFILYSSSFSEEGRPHQRGEMDTEYTPQRLSKEVWVEQPTRWDVKAGNPFLIPGIVVVKDVAASYRLDLITKSLILLHVYAQGQREKPPGEYEAQKSAAAREDDSPSQMILVRTSIFDSDRTPATDMLTASFLYRSLMHSIATLGREIRGLGEQVALPFPATPPPRSKAQVKALTDGQATTLRRILNEMQRATGTLPISPELYLATHHRFGSRIYRFLVNLMGFRRWWRLIKYHFKMAQCSSMGFPRDRNIVVRLSHYLAMLPKAIDDRVPIINVHGIVLRGIYALREGVIGWYELFQLIYLD